MAHPAEIYSKLTDADGENSETETWLDFAKDSGYLKPSIHEQLTSESRQIGAMLGKMLNNPKAFVLKD